jgi:hypothetical protein
VNRGEVDPALVVVEFEALRPAADAARQAAAH